MGTCQHLGYWTKCWGVAKGGEVGENGGGGRGEVNPAVDTELPITYSVDRVHVQSCK